MTEQEKKVTEMLNRSNPKSGSNVVLRSMFHAMEAERKRRIDEV
jgi:hypothetical protein